MFFKKSVNSSEIDRFVNLLADSNDKKQKKAIIELIKIGQNAIEPIENRLKNNSNKTFKRNAIEVFIKIGGDRIVEHLINALNDYDLLSFTRLDAAYCLKNSNDKRAKEALNKYLNDTNNDGNTKLLQELDNAVLQPFFDETLEEIIIKKMIEFGFNVNTTNKYGQTLLMKAASYGLPSLASTLIELGANVNAKDNHGNSALDLATTSGRVYVASELASALARGTALKNADVAEVLKRSGAK